MILLDRVLNTPLSINLFEENCPILSSSFAELAKDQFDEGHCYLVGVIVESNKPYIFDGKAIYIWTQQNPNNPFTRSPIEKVHYFATNAFIHGNRFCFIATQYLKYYNAEADLTLEWICSVEHNFVSDYLIHERVAHYLDRTDDHLCLKLAQGFFYEIKDPVFIDPYFKCLFEYLGEQEVLDLADLRKYLHKREDDDAQYCLAMLYRSGLGGPSRHHAARIIFKKLAKLGNVRAQWMYGQMVFDGRGGKRGSRRGLSYLKKAAISGLPEAQHLYAKLLNERSHNFKKALEVRKFYKLAALHGDAIAAYQYAALAFRDSMTYISVDKVEKYPPGQYLHESNGRRFIHISALLGYCSGQYMIAYMAYYAQGGPRDLPLAREFFKQAADQGSQDAQYRFAMMAFFGEGGPVDREIAIEYFEKADPTLAIPLDFSVTLASRRMSLPDYF